MDVRGVYTMSGESMKRWERWSKLTFLGALLSQLFLPSPSAIGARLRARLGLASTSAALSVAIATQQTYTSDLFGIDGDVGTAGGCGGTAGGDRFEGIPRVGVEFRHRSLVCELAS
jgi:hypothetical protein